MNSDVVAVRRFNRTVTRRLGVLNDHFLAQDRPLGQARLLWEIGRSPDGVTVRELRRILDVDSGYLSRLLRSLEAEGLIVLTDADGDARVRTAQVTPTGAAEYTELKHRSDDAARQLLGPLSQAQRARLTTAMGEVERLLMASQVRIDEVSADSPAAQQAARSYYRELADRLRDGFDPTVGGAVRDTAIMAPNGLLLLATLQGETVGCGALALQDGGFAEIKRVWTAPSARGLGLGRRIMTTLIDRAAAAQAHTVRLDTNGALTEAISLYHSLGFHEVPPYNDNPYAHHWFALEVAATP